MPVTNLPYDSRLNERAKDLRRKMTPQERKLWYAFLRTYPVKIYKQRIIKFFVVDFYCAEARLVIELDGSQHYTEQGKVYDEERSAIMEGYGIEVLRFSNREVNQQFDAVCERIDERIRCRMAELRNGTVACGTTFQSGLRPPAPLVGKTPSGRREMSRIATEGGRPLARRRSLRNAKASPTRRGVTAGDGEVA